MSVPDSTEPIVVGTDGSAQAERAVRWAATDAAVRRRPLRIVHAVERWLYSAPMLPQAGIIDSLAATGQNILDASEQAVRKQHPDLEVTTELIMYPPGRVLRDQSKHAFEVVIGHRGRGGFTSSLLGSVGLQVAGHTCGPAVIVRGDAAPIRGEIVVGIDISEDCQPALAYAFEAASLRGARLRAVHGWQLPPTLVQAGYVIDLTDVEESVRWSVVRAHALLRKQYPDVEVTEEIVRDHPVTALTNASRTADLVVVGARSRSGLGTVRLGSVSHGIIHQAHCPVAVVRPRDEQP